jgi:hypothetical protein
MSYSFSAQAATKAELKTKVAEQLAAVVVAQPVHAADQSQAQAAADAFIDLVADDATQDVLVNVSGSLWSTDAGLLSASVNINASLQARKA